MTEQTNIVSYPAKFVEEPEGGYSVTFRDVPEAITQGDTLEEAKEMAGFALTTAFEFYREFIRKIPVPSEIEDGEVLVTVKRP